VTCDKREFFILEEIMGLSYEDFKLGYERVYQQGPEVAEETIADLLRLGHTLFRVYVDDGGFMTEERYIERCIYKIPDELTVGPFLVTEGLADEPSLVLRRPGRYLLGIALYKPPVPSNVSVDTVE